MNPSPSYYFCQICRKKLKISLRESHERFHMRPLTKVLDTMPKAKIEPKQPSAFVRVANLDREHSEITEKKAYRGELEDVELEIEDLYDLVNGKRDWIIIGESEANRTDKGAAIFARLSKSGKAVTFYIGDQLYVMNIQNIRDVSRKFIGISRPRNGA